jgi:hypothetical protein
MRGKGRGCISCLGKHGRGSGDEMDVGCTVTIWAWNGVKNTRRAIGLRHRGLSGGSRKRVKPVSKGRSAGRQEEA